MRKLLLLMMLLVGSRAIAEESAVAVQYEQILLRSGKCFAWASYQAPGMLRGRRLDGLLFEREAPRLDLNVQALAATVQDGGLQIHDQHLDLGAGELVPRPFQDDPKRRRTGLDWQTARKYGWVQAPAFEGKQLIPVVYPVSPQPDHLLAFLVRKQGAEIVAGSHVARGKGQFGLVNIRTGRVARVLRPTVYEGQMAGAGRGGLTMQPPVLWTQAYWIEGGQVSSMSGAKLFQLPSQTSIQAAWEIADMLFLASDGELSCYHANSGRQLWSHPTPGRTLELSLLPDSRLGILTFRNGPWLPEASQRPLTEKELAGLSKEQLRRLRNEIFARHGRLFQDPSLQRYFRAQSWYGGDSGYSDARLTTVEKANVAQLQRLEDAR